MDPNLTTPPTQPTPQPLQPPVEMPKKSSKKKILIIIVLLVLVVLILLSLTIAFFGRDGEDYDSGNSITPTGLPNQTVSPGVSVKPTLMPFPSEGVSVDTLTVRYKVRSTPDDLKGSERYNEINEIYTQVGVISQEKIDDYDPNQPDVVYKLTFKEGVDLEKASLEIYKLPEIDHVEPEAIFKINN